MLGLDGSFQGYADDGSPQLSWGLTGWLVGPVLYLGGALVLAVVGLVLTLRRRCRPVTSRSDVNAFG